MMKGEGFKLENKHRQNLKRRIEGYEFDTGILKDSNYKKPLNKKLGLSTLAGGQVRKKSRINSDMTISDVSAEIRVKTKINIFTAPFYSKTNKEILRFSKGYIKALVSSGVMKEKRRIENLIQAIIRNPITRGDYGSNGPATVKNKGFNRFLIDTGQLFKSITAKVIKKSV